MQTRNEELVRFLDTAYHMIKNIEQLCSQKEYCQRQYRPTQGGYIKIWRGMKPAFTKLWLIVVVGVGVYSLEPYAHEFMLSMVFDYGFHEILGYILVNVFNVLVIVLAVLLVQEFANHRIIKKNRKNADRLEANKQHNYQVEQQEYALNRQINTAAAEYNQFCGNIMPPSYKNNSYAVGQFLDYAVNGRVMNMQQAVNLYEDEQHKRRMEENQRQLIETERINGIMNAAALNRIADSNDRLVFEEQQKTRAYNDLASAVRSHTYY